MHALVRVETLNYWLKTYQENTTFILVHPTCHSLTLKAHQSRQSWHECVKLSGLYSHSQFQKVLLNSLQEKERKKGGGGGGSQD